ncbi:hypothetical protein CGCA056_v001945 [Colletotrichum aenigma]|uniref:uncharacterized protein n=1 Tax=Colletotrichum aenigma TaxID=1215731 RepID=UPI001872AE93|nr:uncharacterized protein CGCA056_v001945 [Colletotrichum aenigma]KAF5527562.1 hypothetical protein CGCA056_v001945 [Colletotrichum aenigma]
MHFDTGDGSGPSRQDEDNYWQTLLLSHEAEDEQHNSNFMAKSEPLRMRLAALTMEKRDLGRRMLEVNQAIKREHGGLEELTMTFQEDRQKLQTDREARVQHMQAYFAQHRQREDENRARIAAAALAAPRRDSETVRLAHTSDVMNGTKPNGVNGVTTNGDHLLSNNGLPPSANPPDQPVTMIMDASGQRIGPVHRIPVHGAAGALLDKSPKRAVQLRPGVMFTEQDLRRIHEDKDLWTAVMIQAIGDQQTDGRRCAVCVQGGGPFSDCTIVQGLGSCANSYWERRKQADGQAVDQAPPTAQHAKVISTRDESFNGTATPMSSRPVSRDKSTGEGSTIADDTEEDHTPITRANLVLKHDGKVYTHPECMEGVPIERIDPSHPYWDQSWPEIPPLIQASLESWQVKLDNALRTGQKGMKFQLGRQVNRGGTIMSFLKDGEISPYQLLSKKYVTTKLVNYDTLFRLADTLKCLETFGTLDITPLEWLRQRLHEILTESGSDFSLSKTIHDFYHDRKYDDLRKANGKKSIGRPSGMKMTPRDSPNSAKATPNAKKRKMFISEEFPGPSPQRPLAPTPTPQNTQPIIKNDESERSAPPTPDLARKKLKAGRVQGNPKDPDLAYEGFTDVDEFSSDRIGKHDWALNRIKSRLNTVGTGVTQYWHWIPDDGELVFEHQVLAEGESATWGIYAKPINFHLELETMQEIMWAADTVKVLIRCKPGVVVSADGKPRGDLLVEFKRQRTKKRFLAFCRKKGIPQVKIDASIIEQAWDAYESPDVPAMADSEIE